MVPYQIDPELIETIIAQLKEKGCYLSQDEVSIVINLIKDKAIFHYIDQVIHQADTIIDINPSLTEKEILETLAMNVVEFLRAEAASIRIYNPRKEEMVSFGSYPRESENREEAIPFEDTIAGDVVKNRKSYIVPSILKEERYKNREKVEKYGIHSMLALPISIPRFSLKDVDTEGSFQIYFLEKNRAFTPLEAKIAEMLSRRVSPVVEQEGVRIKAIAGTSFGGIVGVLYAPGIVLMILRRCLRTGSKTPVWSRTGGWPFADRSCWRATAADQHPGRPDFR